ncbi:MAG: hypothetical protein ABEJ61_01500 [Haloferacaceae archaeon]
MSNVVAAFAKNLFAFLGFLYLLVALELVALPAMLPGFDTPLMNGLVGVVAILAAVAIHLSTETEAQL